MGVAYEPLFQVFNDVRKAYNSLDQGRCMEIQCEYGLVPRLQQLLQRYLEGQRLVTKARKYYGRPISTERGVTQVYLVSLTLFNIMVDSVFRETLQDICVTQEAEHGFRWLAGEHNVCFYADDRRIAGKDLIWDQTALIKMVRMFERVGLQRNLNNNKSMILTLGFIWGKQETEAYKRRVTGEGPTFRERNKTRVSCNYCGETMAASSLRQHMERAYGRVLPQVRGVDIWGGVLEVYKVLFPWILKLLDCPVEG